MIDIHAHPFLMGEIANNGIPALEALLERASEAGVSHIIGAAVDADSGYQLAAWSKKYPALLVALGWHPWYIENIPQNYLSQLETMCQNTANLVAIGEIGLDGTIGAPMEEQIKVFKEQLDLAQKLKLPAIIHARHAAQKVVDILLSRDPQVVVLHSFSGSYEQLDPLMSRQKVFISFSGSVTRPRAKKIHRLATMVPDEAILLETDSPSIKIENMPGEVSEPSFLPLIAEKLAELRGTDLVNIKNISEVNTKLLLGMKNE